MFTINQNLIDNIANTINNKEEKSNKTTSLSSESTDTEYPSAKAVYDSLSSVYDSLSSTSDNVSSAITAISNRITNLNEANINIVGTPYYQLGGTTATSLVTLLHNIDNNFGDILFCAYNVGGTADAFTISGTGGFGNLTSNHPFILLAYNNIADSNAGATLTINNTMNPVVIVNNRIGGSASCAWKQGEWGIFYIANGSAQLLGSFSDTEYYQGMEFVTSTNTQNSDMSLTGVTHKLNNLKDGTIFFYQLPNLRFTSEATTFTLTLRNNISLTGALKENNVNQPLNKLSPNDILILQYSYSANSAAYNIIGTIKANTFTEQQEGALQLLCNVIFPYRIFTVNTVKKEDKRTTYILTYDGTPYTENEILYVYVPEYEVTTDKKPILSWESSHMPSGSTMYIYPPNSSTALYEHDLNGYYLKIQYSNYRWVLLDKTNNIVEATTEHAGLLSTSDKTKLNSLHTIATSGSYNDLANKPTIPSKTSDLTNDSGFLTSHQSLDGYLQTTDVKDNLTSTDTDKPLSAKQGKELKTLIDAKPNASAIPTTTSQLSNDGDGNSNKYVLDDGVKTINNQSILGTGNLSIDETKKVCFATYNSATRQQIYFADYIMRYSLTCDDFTEDNKYDDCNIIFEVPYDNTLNNLDYMAIEIQSTNLTNPLICVCRLNGYAQAKNITGKGLICGSLTYGPSNIMAYSYEMLCNIINTFGEQVIDVSSKEDISNKVTSISSSSTDTQYPSAKCVYDLIGDAITYINQ